MTSVKRFVSFHFLNLRHSVRLLGRVISPSQGHYLHTKTLNTSMPRVGFEPTIPAFERAKTSSCLTWCCHCVRRIVYTHVNIQFGPGFKPGSGHVGFCDGQKWRWGRFSPRTSVSPANLHSIYFSTIIFTIIQAWHNRPGVAAVPIASQTRIKKKKLILSSKNVTNHFILPIFSWIVNNAVSNKTIRE
jgi:hypothetical protein